MLLQTAFMIDNRLISLRKKVRENRKFIIDSILNNHGANICAFCGSEDNLTKEHVLPKWAFGNCEKKYFETKINKLNQRYIQTTIPACFDCNSFILGYFECYIEKEFNNTSLDIDYFTDKTIEKIIIWLELIDYKFQILNLRRKFIKIKDRDFIPYLANFPLSIIQSDESTSPSKVFSNVRNALKKLSIKSKQRKINSLVIFKTSNESFHFFNKMNEFIFIELPKHNLALFYFYEKEFNSSKESFDHAMEIIKKVY